ALSWRQVLKTVFQSQCSLSLSSPGLHSPVECCFAYRESQLPVAYLMDFYRTSTDCFMPAVVFETKNRSKICTNPEEAWVKKAIQKLQKRK
ncbi:CC4L protein, partial [Ardeotis kori]|nr:CC4L protein [Ardeotis kori]